MQSETSRQDFEAQKMIIELEEAGYKRDLAKTQLQSIQMSTLPHRQYGPHLRNDGLEWVATFGEDPNSRVCGTGDSPSAALVAFDSAWLGLDK